jgi:hypothetical protein
MKELSIERLENLNGGSLFDGELTAAEACGFAVGIALFTGFWGATFAVAVCLTGDSSK